MGNISLYLKIRQYIFLENGRMINVKIRVKIIFVIELRV